MSDVALLESILAISIKIENLASNSSLAFGFKNRNTRVSRYIGMAKKFIRFKIS